jgi:hypothetical protein
MGQSKLILVLLKGICQHEIDISFLHIKNTVSLWRLIETSYIIIMQLNYQKS